jgi:hypothetical protein
LGRRRSGRLFEHWREILRSIWCNSYTYDYANDQPNADVCSNFNAHCNRNSFCYRYSHADSDSNAKSHTESEA